MPTFARKPTPDPDTLYTCLDGRIFRAPDGSDHQIRMGVTIQITDSGVTGLISSRKFSIGLKRAVTITQEHRHIVAAPVGGRYIHIVIAIQIHNNNGIRIIPGRKFAALQERAITLTDQYGDTVQVGIP